MKLRIFLFFSIIAVVASSYLIFDFNETSDAENRTLKSSFEFENGIFAAVLDTSFQTQLEDILSDQIIIRNKQVDLQANISNIFGRHNRFTDGQYLYNDKTILTMDSYTNTNYLKDSYTDKYYNQVEEISKQLSDKGSSFDIYFINIEPYYCRISLPGCDVIGTEKENANFFYADDVLKEDEYAFIGGDHHLTQEAHFALYQNIVSDLNIDYQVKSFDDYVITDSPKEVIGSREKLAKNKFGVSGVEYEPIFDSGMTLYENGNTYDVDEFYEWDGSAGTANKAFLSAGYCGKDTAERRIETDTGKFYIENPNAPITENILLIGDSQICGVSSYFYSTFNQTHTLDYRNQKIDVVQYVEDNDIDYVVFYGTKPFDSFSSWFNKEESTEAVTEE